MKKRVLSYWRTLPALVSAQAVYHPPLQTILGYIPQFYFGMQQVVVAGSIAAHLSIKSVNTIFNKAMLGFNCSTLFGNLWVRSSSPSRFIRSSAPFILIRWPTVLFYFAICYLFNNCHCLFIKIYFMASCTIWVGTRLVLSG